VPLIFILDVIASLLLENLTCKFLRPVFFLTIVSSHGGSNGLLSWLENRLSTSIVCDIFFYLEAYNEMIKEETSELKAPWHVK